MSVRSNPRTTVPALLALGLLAACSGNEVPEGVIAETPNVVPLSVEFSPVSVVNGTTVQVADTLRNIGPRPTRQFEVGIFLSKDETIDINDTLIGVRRVGEVPTAGFSSDIGKLAVNIEPGIYFVGVLLDFKEQLVERRRGDNALLAKGTLEVMPSTVDLTVGSLIHAQCTLSRGDSLDLTDVTRNVGGDPVNGVRVGFYASSDRTITAEDTLLGHREITSLDAGGSSAGQTRLPVDLEPGTYYIGAIVDSDQTIFEVIEENNATASTSCAGKLVVTLPPAPPELSLIRFLHGPCGIEQGQEIVLDYAVGNRGGNPAKDFGIVFFASKDNVIDLSDVMIGSAEVPGLDAGKSFSGSVQARITLAPGTWYIGSVVDLAQDVIERDENNNVMLSNSCGQQLLVTAPPRRPELESTTVGFGTCSVERSSQIALTDTVRNNGDAAAGRFRVGFYASTDDIIDSSDQLLATRQVDDLAPSAASNGTTTASIDLEPGTYWIGAVADDLDAVSESNETNNSRVATTCFGRLTVTEPSRFADLVPQTFSLADCSVTRGDRTSAIANVANRDLRDAGAFRVGVYASLDADVTPSDTLLGFSEVAGVKAFSQTEVTLDLNIDLAPGDYYVAIIVDDRKAVAESDENNNQRSSSSCSGKLTVTPRPGPADLSVDAFSTGQCKVVRGGTIDVVFRIENRGGTTAPPYRFGVFVDSKREVTFASQRIASFDAPELGPGRTFTHRASVKVDLVPATRFIAAIVDYDRAVADSNRFNDVLLSQSCDGQLEVTPPPGKADLEMRVLQHWLCSVSSGSRITVLDAVGNRGTAPAGPFSVKIYASRGAKLDTKRDTLLDYRVVEQLDAGRYSSRQRRIRVQLLPGRYFIRAIAGPLTDEVNTADNEMLSTTCGGELIVR